MRDRINRLIISVAVSLGAIVAALLVSAIIVKTSGVSPVDAGQALWDGAFDGRAHIAGTLSKMIPLILVALGWIIAYRVRRVNIGLEGQILAGGILATIVGLNLGGLPLVIHLPLAVLAGIVGGTIWMGIAAVLWVKRGVNEIISTLMLNLIAIQLVSWLVRGPLQEPTGTFPRSGPVFESARWPRLLEQTSLSWDFILAIAMAFAMAFVLNRTTFGFRLRFTGANEEAARHGGIRTMRVSFFAMLASGALAGLAGSSLILGGESSSMADNFSANYGFEGIVVALLARNNPIAVIPAALLFAALRTGGGLMEARAGVSSQIVFIVQGLVILFVAGSAFLLDRQRAVRVDARGAKKATPSTGLAEAH